MTVSFPIDAGEDLVERIGRHGSFDRTLDDNRAIVK
jgi:hypothetical protein